MEHARVTKCGLSVDGSLYDFLADEVLPGSGVEPETFWEGFARLVAEFGPRNRDLLIERDRIQASIDEWHRGRAGDHDAVAYRELLERIGYLVPQGPPFEITTTDVDPEVALVAGPQLVVPLQNPRYALNAANARWGSLYDAVYGTDVLGDRPAPGPYDPIRGGRVIGWVRALLDQMIPLADGSHSDSTGYAVDGACLRVRLAGGGATGLVEPDAFAGFRGPAAAPTSVLFRHHGLHIELRIDRADPVGSGDPAGISDVVLESAVTVIMDCEDSVAAVDAVDKVGVYRNWLGLMRGDLVAEVPSPGGAVIRRLAPDRTYQRPDGVRFNLPGRAVMFVRNVGHLMTTDAVLDRDGRDVPEGLLDAVVTVLAALHDLNKRRPLNSRTAAIYVVKPKMHGPAEVAFADALFARVEALFGLAAGTVKLGLMDEERRTSVNLAECIRAVAHRVAFINTGFLDRTGDEIHTSMHAGPMIPKTTMKMAPWLAVYEARNVAVGLACGFRGRAQIGKGMWTAPDLMAAMLAEKSAHPLAGASCAWVPSPTAATLHALHYHQVDVSVRQRELSRAPIPDVDDLLQLPLLSPGGVTVGERAAEIDNNAQGILGYVVRWVDQGVGCSKVPDIRDVALMEDRATCRISSQHLANWVRHGLVGADEVLAAMRRMSAVVDRQNADDPLYHPMAPAFDGPAFRAACELVLAGSVQPCGYTEPILHAHRREAKSLPLAPGRAS